MIYAWIYSSHFFFFLNMKRKKDKQKFFLLSPSRTSGFPTGIIKPNLLCLTCQQDQRSTESPPRPEFYLFVHFNEDTELPEIQKRMTVLSQGPLTCVLRGFKPHLVALILDNSLTIDLTLSLMKAV